MKHFNDMGLSIEIQKAISNLGFETPTEVQQLAIPHILGSDQDLVALAQTGTGKTAAFGLPLLQRISVLDKKIQVLILCPTRELCLQIAKDLKSYASFSKDVNIAPVFGGADIRHQIREIRSNPQIIVGTPGRVQDLINRKVLKLDHISWLVLDEADEMLNMGFKDELDNILLSTPKTRTTLLFSATMPKEISRITHQYMKDFFIIKVNRENPTATQIQHVYYKIHERDRYEALRRILDYTQNIYGIVFCRTKIETQEVASKLMQDGYQAEAIHGDLSQAQRGKAMSRFKEKKINILVATDVAARGIDVKELTHVINYNLPDSIETYTHRSGRTGRAGKEGISIILINMREKRQLLLTEKRCQIKFEKMLVPSGNDIINAKINSLFNGLVKQDDQKTEQIDTILDKLLLSVTSDELSKDNSSVEVESYKIVAKKLLHLMLGSLMKKYKNAYDINVSASHPSTNSSHSSSRFNSGSNGSGNQTRQPYAKQNPKNIKFEKISINKGRKDRFIKKDLFRMLNKMKGVRNVEIGKIEILDDKTIFEIDTKWASTVKRNLKV